MRSLKYFYSSMSPLPKLYAKACASKPKDYYDYKEYKIKYGYKRIYNIIFILFGKFG